METNKKTKQTENRSKIQRNGSGKEKKVQRTIRNHSITFLTVRLKVKVKKTFPN